MDAGRRHRLLGQRQKYYYSSSGISRVPCASTLSHSSHRQPGKTPGEMPAHGVGLNIGKEAKV